MGRVAVPAGQRTAVRPDRHVPRVAGHGADPLQVPSATAGRPTGAPACPVGQTEPGREEKEQPPERNEGEGLTQDAVFVYR